MDDKCSTGLIQPLDNNWLAHWHKVLPPLTPGPSWVYFCTFWRLHFFHLPHFFTFQCNDCTSQHFLLFKYYISLQLNTLFLTIIISPLASHSGLWLMQFFHYQIVLHYFDICGSFSNNTESTYSHRTTRLSPNAQLSVLPLYFAAGPSPSWEN